MKNAFQIIQVDPAYVHSEKVIQPHGVIDPAVGRRKWYDIARSDQPIEPSIRDLARSFVSRKLKTDESFSTQELGFVLLHRCGEGYYFLGLCTWRENNELWKSLFYLDTDKMEDFAHFAQDERHRDTFCVWELEVVCHERRAWTTYLNSHRTDEDADRYLLDSM